MPWILETLTPVFIGSGQEPASSLDFLVEPDGARLRFIPFDDLVEALADSTPLMQWIEGSTRPTLQDMLSQPWAQALRTRLQAYPPLPLFTTASAPTDVARFLQDGLRRPYIPGSSLKGALRMALLYDFLMMQDASFFSNLLNRMDREEAQAREKNRPFHAGSWLEQQAFRGRERDATWDLLRAIAVADTAPIRPQRFFVGEVQLVGSQRTLSIHVEALMPHCQIQIFPVRTPTDQAQALEMMQNQRRPWDERLTTLYAQGWPVVARACYRWSQDLLAAEIDHWRWLGQQARWQSIAQDVTSQLQALQNQNQEERPILRIGMHRGALSLTIGLAIRSHLGPNSEEYRRWARRVVRGNRPVSDRSPKTRKAIYYQGRWWPLGWVRLGPQPEPT
ncbi:hypothetical protein HRbin11_02161 [bacterium HR11]|nr:hypothetical protein HRbin11_02161 [bacterium HR11]